MQKKMKSVGVYLHLPRTGGTFLRSYFAAAAPQIIQVGHRTIKELDSWKRGNILFGFIRNPFDWYISRYFYFRRVPVAERGVSITCDSGLAGDEFSERFPTFKDHMLWGLEHCDNFWFTDRYKDMYYADGDDQLNIVYHFEAFYEAICDIFELLRIKPRVDYVKFCNKVGSETYNNTEHVHYSKYYDDELVDLVNEKDGELMNWFGYNYEVC